MKEKRLILNKILGLYFGYPECCIEDFIKRGELEINIPQEIIDDIRFCAGYIPCLKCYKEMDNYSIDKIKKRMKRNIYEEKNVFHFLKITYTKQFVFNSKKYKFPIEEYRNYLKTKIKNLPTSSSL
jgi:hypothetical protein